MNETLQSCCRADCLFKNLPVTTEENQEFLASWYEYIANDSNLFGRILLCFVCSSVTLLAMVPIKVLTTIIMVLSGAVPYNDVGRVASAVAADDSVEWRQGLIGRAGSVVICFFFKPKNCGLGDAAGTWGQLNSRPSFYWREHRRVGFYYTLQKQNKSHGKRAIAKVEQT